MAYAPSTTIKYFKDLLVEKTELELVCELVRYCGRCGEFLSDLSRWEVPTLPVNGHDVMATGVANSPMVGVVLRHLKDVWKESGYCLNREELLARVGEVGGAARGEEGEDCWDRGRKRRKMKK